MANIQIKCDICKDLIEDKYYTDHMRYIHKVTTQLSFRCSDQTCVRIFSSLNALRNHVRKTAHGVSSTTSTNNRCNDISDSNLELVNVPMDTDCNYDTMPESETSEPILESIDLHNEVLGMVSYFYSDPLLSRIQVQRILDHFQTFLQCNWMKSLEQVCLHSAHQEVDKINISGHFKSIETTFEQFSTEYKRLQQLKTANGYIEPEEVVLGYRETKNKSGHIENMKTTCQFIPLRKTLTKFF